MKLCMLLVMCLLSIPQRAQAEVRWNQQHTAPYVTQEERKHPEIVRSKMALAAQRSTEHGVPLEVARRFEVMAVSILVDGRVPTQCQNSRLPAELLLTVMGSGKEHFIPNVRVGNFAKQPGVTAWQCHITFSGGGKTTEAYMVIPDCDNVSYVLMQNGECIPSSVPCDENCKRYVEKYVS